MEKFNLEKHWEDFKVGRIVVNCRTEEKAKEFLNYLDTQKFRWNDGTTMFDNYEEDTCYLHEDDLTFASADYFTKNKYTIVEFTGFSKESPKQNPAKVYNQNFTCILHPYTITWTIKEDDKIIDIKTIENERETYKVYVYNKQVKVILPDGTRGIAKCDDVDKFDINKGKDIAHCRAMIKSLNKELKKLVK